MRRSYIAYIFSIIRASPSACSFEHSRGFSLVLLHHSASNLVQHDLDPANATQIAIDIVLQPWPPRIWISDNISIAVRIVPNPDIDHHGESLRAHRRNIRHSTRLPPPSFSRAQRPFSDRPPILQSTINPFLSPAKISVWYRRQLFLMCRTNARGLCPRSKTTTVSVSAPTVPRSIFARDHLGTLRIIDNNQLEGGPTTSGWSSVYETTCVLGRGVPRFR